MSSGNGVGMERKERDESLKRQEALAAPYMDSIHSQDALLSTKWYMNTSKMSVLFAKCNRRAA